jgi:hypothetical protein
VRPERVHDRAGLPRIERVGEGGAADPVHEPVGQLVPRIGDLAARDQHQPARCHHADELRHDRSPGRHQMEDVTDHCRTEAVLVERQCRGVPDDEWERCSPTRLLDELGEHRCGQIETDERHPRRRERQRDESGAHADLEGSTAAAELAREEHGHLPRSLLGQAPRAVVVLDRPIEAHRPAHDFGISFVGSTNGSVATVASRVPSWACSARAVPTAMCAAGTQA